jgi:hypothetical protein
MGIFATGCDSNPENKDSLLAVHSRLHAQNETAEPGPDLDAVGLEPMK